MKSKSGGLFPERPKNQNIFLKMSPNRLNFDRKMAILENGDKTFQHSSMNLGIDVPCKIPSRHPSVGKDRKRVVIVVAWFISAMTG